MVVRLPDNTFAIGLAFAEWMRDTRQEALDLASELTARAARLRAVTCSVSSVTLRRVLTPKEPSRYTDMPVHFYTCDRHIAEKYHATFAPYFYIFSPCDFDAYDALTQEAYQRDVFFIGEEKGDRRARIDFTEGARPAGLTHELRLVPQNRHRSLFHRHNPAGVGYMPYSVVQERVRTSRAILELISDGQTGLTQRSFEALFLRRSSSWQPGNQIHCDFYHPQEHLHLRRARSLEELPDFLHRPFHPIAPKIVQQYTLAGWLQHFLRA